jgi:TetR/AcrR family transcriptional regulator, tetracycline repressor protein
MIRAVTKPNRSARPTDAVAGGQRPHITREKVIDTALRIADESTLAGVTMRAVANELDVYPNALYSHIGSRAELVSALSMRIFEDVLLPDARGTAWDQWLREVARRWRAAVHKHPNVATLAGTQLPTTSRAMPFVERVLDVLTSAGFPEAELVPAFNAYAGFVLSWPTLELADEPEAAPAGWKEQFGRDLDAVDPNTFPNLARAMPLMRNCAFMTRWDSGRSAPMDESFEFSLDVLLAGLAAKLPAQP